MNVDGSSAVLERVRVRPGREAVAWLLDRIRAEQGDDPLREVTVLVPSPRVGLVLRRRLAASGYANVRFETVAILAERLARPALAGAGRRALTAPVDAALARAALHAGTGLLARAADRPGLAEAVGRLSRELRRRPDPAAAAAAVRSAGTVVSGEAADAVVRYDRLRADHRVVDDVDVLMAAAEGAPSAAGGPVIVLLPRRPDAREEALYVALAAGRRVVLAEPAEEDGDASAVRVVVGADPEEEVRAAVRRLLEAAERADAPAALHRCAVVWAGGDHYRDLVRDCLDAAGIPVAGLRGRPLGETLPGRALRALVALPQQDFTRASVLAFLSGLPDGPRVLADQAVWDRISRDAGIVRGAEQWRSRLTTLIRRELERANDLRDEDKARRDRHRRNADQAQELLAHVEGLVARCTLPQRATWPVYVERLSVLVDEFLRGQRWSDPDLENLQAVREVVEGLGAAAEVEPDTDLATVVRTLDDALARRTRPEGRVGHGVLMGVIDDLRGLDLDAVAVVGCIEGVLPAGPAPDPLVAGDVVDRQGRESAEQAEAWRVALASAAEVTVCAPRVDTEGRPAYPSPWVLRLLAGAGVPAPTAVAVRDGELTHPRLDVMSGSDDGLRRARAQLSLADLREAEVLARGGDLDATGVAHDPALPLVRARETHRARSSDHLTEFDGNVAAAAGEDLVAAGVSVSVRSATGLQTWATCPFQHLLGSVLGVHPTEDPDTGDTWWRMQPTERGSLFHGILERYHGERLGRPLTEVDLPRLQAIAAEEFETARADGITGHDLVWRGESGVLLADLMDAVQRDAEEGAEWRPLAVEQGFGWETPGSWPAVTVALEGERAVRLHGYIDRVDDTADGRHRVLDYKTGRRVASQQDVDALGAGRLLQLPIYGSAVRARQRAVGDVAQPVLAAYWYATRDGKFERRSLDVDDAMEERLHATVRAIDAGVRAGAFPQVPGGENDYWATWENCRYCSFHTLCPASRDVLATRKCGDAAVQYHAALGDVTGAGGAVSTDEGAGL